MEHMEHMEHMYVGCDFIFLLQSSFHPLRYPLSPSESYDPNTPNKLRDITSLRTWLYFYHSCISCDVYMYKYTESYLTQA